MTLRTFLLAAASTPLFAACPATDLPSEDTGTPPEAYPATWAGMESLFVDHCDSCHPAQQGLDLHTGIPEDIAGDQLFVVPGNPDASLMWLEVSGQSTLTMPLDGVLDAAVVEPMRVWIEAGAVVD